ncbi:hypothetical protein ACLKA6_005908 [Drosophila palustris]
MDLTLSHCYRGLIIGQKDDGHAENDKDILCVYMHICKAKEQLSSSSVFDLRFEAGGNGMTRKAQKAAQAMPLHVIVWHKIGKMKLKMVVEMEWK